MYSKFIELFNKISYNKYDIIGGVRMKRFLSVIIFVLCTTILFGCATIEYQHWMHPDGSIEDIMIFEIDQDVDRTVATNIINDVFRDVQNYYAKPLIAQRDQYGDINIRDGITVQVLSNNDIDPKFRYVKVVTRCETQELFELLNTNILPHVYQANVIDLNKDTDKDKSGYSVSAFIIKYIEKTSNAFGDISNFSLELKDDSQPVKNFTEVYAEKYADGEFKASDIKLRQMFVTTDLRLKSDADAIMEQDGYKYHLWELDTSNPDQELMFYYQTANSTGWYYLALGITFVIMFLLIMTYGVRVGKTKHATSDEDVQIDEDDKDL